MLSDQTGELVEDYDRANLNTKRRTLRRCASFAQPLGTSISHHNLHATSETIVMRRSVLQQEDPTAYPPSVGGTNGTTSLRSAENQRLQTGSSSAVKPQRQAQSIGCGGSFVAACYGCTNCNYGVCQVQSSRNFSPGGILSFHSFTKRALLERPVLAAFRHDLLGPGAMLLGPRLRA
jgi:hypothetical protein